MNKKAELWGVGIMNGYGEQVKLGWGDNLYRNSYLDGRKDLTLFLPIPFQKLTGRYVFTVHTSTRSKEVVFELTDTM